MPARSRLSPSSSTAERRFCKPLIRVQFSGRAPKAGFLAKNLIQSRQMLPPEQKELFAPYFEVTAQENGPLFFPVLRACQELGISIPTEEKIQIITVPSEILTASEADPAVGEVFVYFNYQNEQLRRQYDSEISLASSQNDCNPLSS